MTLSYGQQDHHARLLIERMQQNGATERDIHRAVRQAALESSERGRPERRPRRFRLFRRR